MLNNRPKRILFIGEAVSLAHIGRPAMLARWANEMGHETFFACGNTMLEVAKQENLKPITIPTIAPSTFYERVRAGRFFYTKSEMTSYITSECKLIERINPDLVVGDFRLTLAISTALTKVPLISLINAYWSPGYDCPLSAPSEGPARFLPQSIREQLFKLVRPLAFRYFAEPLNKIREQHGLRRLSDFREHYTAGTACAYMDLPGWIPECKLPKGHTYIGPVPWSPTHAPQPHLGQTGQSRPLAYVSMGSSGHPLLLLKVLKSLLNEGMDMVVSGVNESCRRVLHTHEPILKKRAYLGQLFDPTSCLTRARIVICHGGSGTIYQAQQAGVPVLSICSNGDQVLASRAASHWGACRWLHAKSANVPQINKQISLLINKHVSATPPSSSPHTYAKEVQRWLKNHDTKQAWQNFLNQMLPSSVPQDTPPVQNRAIAPMN